MLLLEFLPKVKFSKYAYSHINTSTRLCHLNVDERFLLLTICFILSILKNNFTPKAFKDRYLSKCSDLIFSTCALNIFQKLKLIPVSCKRSFYINQVSRSAFVSNKFHSTKADNDRLSINFVICKKNFKVMERILRARGAVRVSPIWPTYCETSTPSAWTVAVPDVGGPHQMAAMVRPHAQSGSSSSDYRRTWTLCRKSIGTNLRWTPELRIGSVYRRSSNFRCDLFCPIFPIVS